jgi:hypothetical protein
MIILDVKVTHNRRITLESLFQKDFIYVYFVMYENECYELEVTRTKTPVKPCCLIFFKTRHFRTSGIISN